MNPLVTQQLIDSTYIVAAVLFILALKWLSSPVSARRGVLAGEIAAALAVGATLCNPEVAQYKWIVIALIIGTAIGVGLLFWPAGIAALFVHAKHHFLTLEFTEAGKKQAAVFEIGKAVPLTLLPILEAKTGKKVEHEEKSK